MANSELIKDLERKNIPSLGMQGWTTPEEYGIVLIFVIFVIFVAKGVEGNACLCRAIVRKWTLDCPKVDTCVNRGDSFSDGYVSGAIFVRK